LRTEQVVQQNWTWRMGGQKDSATVRTKCARHWNQVVCLCFIWVGDARGGVRQM